MEHHIISRETAYSARAFKIERVQMTLPDGRETVYDLVAHPGAVTIVPVDAEGNVYFVKQYRLGAEQVLLELPAGTRVPNETPEACASREVREETGMAAGKLTLVGDFYMAPGYSSEHMYVYLATELSHAPLAQDDDEFITVETIPFAKIMEMAHQNQINDGKSLASLLLAEPYVKYDRK
jgi:ADP-ribose pyrophosphatase